RDMLLE
ncbi:lipocalin family protein, partial [Vibrio cholerae O1 str. EDC-022]